MSFDLRRILESKQAFRRELTGRPVAEKLAMLDALRDRLLTIRAAAAPTRPMVPPQPSPPASSGGGTLKEP
jgi:hypothetical protein